MALLTTTKPAGGSDPPAGFVVSECGPKDEGWEDKRNRWARWKFVFHVKQRSPWCERGVAAAGRWGGVPVVDRFRLTRSRLLPCAGPSAASARRTCRRAWGSRRRRHTSSRGGMDGTAAGGDGGRAGSGPSPLLHWGALQPRGCSRRGDRVPRLGATPLPHDQPCSRSVTCREWGARAELEPWCRRRGAGPVGRPRVRVQTSAAWRSAVLRLSRTGRMAAPDGQVCCAFLCPE